MSSAVKKSGMPALRLQMVDNRIIEQSIKAGEQGTQKISKRHSDIESGKRESELLMSKYEQKRMLTPMYQQKIIVDAKI